MLLFITYMWWKDKFYITYSYYIEDNLFQNYSHHFLKGYWHKEKMQINGMELKREN